ncbi:hypothetical protein D3C78_1051650 [compost metagenome]
MTITVEYHGLSYTFTPVEEDGGIWFMPTRITCPTGDLELHEMAATVQRDRLHVLSLACAEYNAQRA